MSIPFFIWQMDEKVKSTLNYLHKEAARNLPLVMLALSKRLFGTLRPEDLKDAYIAIDQEQGMLLYHTISEKGFKNIVEYGTSFGISTIYLAAAARVTGGRVITTELLAEKAERARKNFIAAGVDDLIEIRVGDVMETLKNFSGNIDCLFLDGWKDQYLPLTKMLEPNFSDKALIVADNLNMKGTKRYLEYVRNAPYYHSETLGKTKGGTEFTYYLKAKMF